MSRSIMNSRVTGSEAIKKKAPENGLPSSPDNWHHCAIDTARDSFNGTPS